MDWLEIRLHELNREVDYFIILESANTFQQTPRPLHLQNNFFRFQPFQHKIIHRVLNVSRVNFPKDDAWARERFTRNALFEQVILSLTGLQAPNQGDVLIVGDIDEIPRTGALAALRNCAFPPRVTLRTQMYNYSYQWLHRGEQWHHPQATYFDGHNTVRIWLMSKMMRGTLLEHTIVKQHALVMGQSDPILHYVKELEIKY